MPRLNAVEICALLLCASAALAHAEDWTTTDGKVYRNVTVLSHTNATVTVLDSDGGATLDLITLPPELQQRYGMDRTAAVAQKTKDDAEAAQEAADLQAQKDKVVADAKARVDQAAYDLAFIAKDRADDEKQLESSNQKATADYSSMDKMPVKGQVLFLTSDKQEFDYASIHVRLFSYDQAHAALDLISARADLEGRKFDPALDQEKGQYTKMAAAPKPGQDDKAKMSAVLKAYNDTLRKYYVYSSQAYYSGELASPVADVVTDASGSFALPIPKTGSWVLVAFGQLKSEAGGHLWIAKVDPAAVAKGEVILNNDNLTGDNALMTIMSDADIDSLVQNKIDELTQK
jgi:hypothetical protein